MKKIAIITGGSSGIGLATALKFADLGYDVGITYNTGKARALSVVNEIEKRGCRGEAEQQDLRAATLGGLTSLVSKLGGIDVFVNNAGINHRGQFLSIEPAEFLDVVTVNLIGYFRAAQFAAKAMIESSCKGSIINVSSILDREPLDGGSAYCASKAGVRQLTKVMALELARHGIRVNAVSPGETATPMNFSDDVDILSLRRPVIPLARPAFSREIAEAIAFLASEKSSYIVGEALLVDGGLSLHGGPQSLQSAVGKPLEGNIE